MEKIISGGQVSIARRLMRCWKPVLLALTGVRKAARPKTGKSPEKYPMMELRGPGYKERTLKNVTAADGTAIIYFGELEGGAEATAYFCIKTGKPYTLIDGNETSVERAVILLSSFVEEKAIRVLNVAGPRATSKQQAYADAYAVVARMLRRSGR